MTKYKYTIKFYDYWHSGSGLSAGVYADSSVVKTKQSLPFVSAKSIKGLMREMLADNDKINCFGQEGIGKDITSTISDAILPKDVARDILRYGLQKGLFDKISTTSIENNIAKDDTLRTQELTVPLELEGEIEIKEECKEKIKNAMHQVKRLGTSRNRGFGRCSIALGDKIDSEENNHTEDINTDKIMLKCTFESDVVFLASSNSEGKSEVLDFVPGSAILGIVAKGINTKKITDIDFESLLNGSIRFGDCTLFKNNTLTYPMPFSLFRPKLIVDNDVNSTKTYNFPYITEEEHKKYQMVQRRKGYIDKNGNLLYPEYDYQQKSSHDKEERRSKEGGMYGYPAMVVGSEFLCSIEADNKAIYTQLVNYLTNGTHRLGKSKSAQYGKVKFQLHNEDLESIESKEPNGNQLAFLYAKSRLALFDSETGQPTYEPTISNLGLSQGEIAWEYTQIRTRSYTPYDSAQRTATYERIIIDKGSVIAIKNAPTNLETHIRVGAFQSEGFGEILVNPAFLSKKHFTIIEPISQENNTPNNNTEEYSGNEPLLKYLANKKASKQTELDIAERVDTLAPRLKGISNSQWGVIRSMTAKPTVTDENIKVEIQKFISKGKSAEKWKQGGKDTILLNAIEEQPYKVRFVKHLCIYMQSLGGNNEV